MSWHGYQKGQQVALADIITTCEALIRSGKVVDVEGKEKLLDQISNCGHTTLIYWPTGSGWGRSPMNPNCWRTLDHQPLPGA
jgi:hypothetical protein